MLSITGRMHRLAPALLAVGLLAACSDSSTSSGQAAQGGAAPGANGQGQAAPQAGFVTIHAQPVALSTTVAGRVVAFQTAEIRPQVNGLIQERVFREGTEVKQGDVLYRIDPQTYQATVTAAEASLQKAQAAETAAKGRADRYSRLSATAVVSQQDREDAVSTYAQAQADTAVAQANLQTARINLDYATIKAPVAGQISTSTVNAGSLVTANQTAALATIRQLDPVYVDLTESSGNLLRFREQIQRGAVRPLVGEGRKTEVRLTFADGTGYDQVGGIDAAERFVSETTSTFTVRSRFANPDRLLLPGMYVRATLSIAVAEAGFLVPQRAVSRNGKGEPTARFIKADGTAETRVLTTGGDIGTNWLVTAGVADGDRLIVDGLQSVRDGGKVNPVEVKLDENGLVQPAGAQSAPAAASAATTSAATGEGQSASSTAGE